MSSGGDATRPAGEIVRFTAADEFEAWLEINHESHPGILLEIAKKGAPQRSITYSEALALALCYGWIDGQKAAADEHHWLQRFTRRTSRSKWSKINRETAERLLAQGRMRDPGLAEIQRAQSDGRWDSAYVGQSAATVPDDLQHKLDADPEAAAAFDQLDRRSRYSIIWRVNDAKRPETRERRIAKYLDMIRRGEPID
jgi:uncharacterized protein YdeI (YjbR/CyaY-like superfamily)